MYCLDGFGRGRAGGGGGGAFVMKIKHEASGRKWQCPLISF